MALFFGIKTGEISPLNLAMLVGLMMGETSSSRSMLAVTIFTTISLAVDPTNRVDYSSVVVSVVGLFLIVLFMSWRLWYHAPDSALAELYGRKKPLQMSDNPELAAASGTQLNKQPSEVKVGTFNHIIPELTADDNPSFARRSRTIGPKKLSGFWSKAFGTDRHNSPRESIPPQDSLPNRTEYHDIVDRDSKGNS